MFRSKQQPPWQRFGRRNGRNVRRRKATTCCGLANPAWAQLELRLPVSGALGILAQSAMFVEMAGVSWGGQAEQVHSPVTAIQATPRNGAVTGSQSRHRDSQGLGHWDFRPSSIFCRVRASGSERSFVGLGRRLESSDLAVGQHPRVDCASFDSDISGFDYGGHHAQQMRANISHVMNRSFASTTSMIAIVPALNSQGMREPIGISATLPLTQFASPRSQSGPPISAGISPTNDPHHEMRVFASPESDHGSEDQSALSEDMSGWLRAVFDNGVWTSGLNFHFERDAAIETMQGAWAVNQPRFGEPFGVQAWYDTVTVIPSTQGMDILGSGWHLDGQTPVICIVNEGLKRLDWYTGLDWSFMRRQTLGAANDLLGGAVTGKAYRPISGIIHEGLHVMLTERWDKTTSQVDGIGFFYTQDFGMTWTEVPNLNPDVVPGIPGHPSALGISRGARWSFANAFPNGSADNQTDAWFPWGDYLRKNGSPKGGQVGVFRATRLFIGSTWTVHPNRVIWNRWELADTGGLHTHGATIHPQTGTVLSFWGDVGYRNEIVAHKFDDLNNYTTSAITTYRGAHGGYDPTGVANQYANQSAGFAPGPEYGTALATADENPERLVVVSVDVTGTKVNLEPLIASSTNETAGPGYNERTCLWIHYVRGRGYVLRETGAVTTGNDNRIWVSENGRIWTKIMAKTGGTPFIFGNRIAFSSPSGKGISTRDWMPVHAVQPLLINPGGWNRQATTLLQRNAPPAGNTVREVFRDESGAFRYVDTSNLLDPQPVSLPPLSPNAPLVEVSINGPRNAGARWLMDPGETADFSAKHYWLGWTYPLETNGLRPTYRIGGPQTGNQTGERGPNSTSTATWEASYHFGNTSNATPSRGSISLFQMHSGTNRWLLASQSLTEGKHPPYPLHPGQQGGNELAWLDGFTARRTWSSVLSFALPEVGFDAWHSNGAIQLPLATIWANDNSYVDVSYFRGAHALDVRIVRDGISVGFGRLFNVWLSKEDRVDLVISSSGPTIEVTLCLPQKGADPEVHSKTLTGNIGIPREIRFSNHNQTEVVPLKWLAAHFHPTQYLNLQQRLDLLRNESIWQRP